LGTRRLDDLMLMTSISIRSAEVFGCSQLQKEKEKQNAPPFTETTMNVLSHWNNSFEIIFITTISLKSGS